MIGRQPKHGANILPNMQIMQRVHAAIVVATTMVEASFPSVCSACVACQPVCLVGTASALPTA